MTWSTMIRLLAKAWWHLADLLDRIPGFTDEIERIYNDDVAREDQEV